MEVESFNKFVREIFRTDKFIPLHAPKFGEIDRRLVMEAIESTFVSSVGKFVDDAESLFATLCNSLTAVATVNGTAALHVALRLAGARENTEVISQSLTFVATANAISFNNAHPVFLDVDLDTMGLSPVALNNFLDEHAEVRADGTFNKLTGREIVACVPMHTFGFPARIDELSAICKKWNIILVEDAAEAVGSKLGDRSLGTFGKFGTFSFNGNKVITSGGGGMIVTSDLQEAAKAKHLTTTGKVSHPFKYYHNEVAYNYRLPNLNAALLVAQISQLSAFLTQKRELANSYAGFFSGSAVKFRLEQPGTTANYWLMCVELPEPTYLDEFLEKTNSAGIMTRPIWELMHDLPMYKHCHRDDQRNAMLLKSKIVNIPSNLL